MSKTTKKNGRFGNQVMRNIALSILAKKYNLLCEYANFDKINNKLGIELFNQGSKEFSQTKIIKKKDFLDHLKNNKKVNYNLDLMHDWFHSCEISNIINNHLVSNQKYTINKNPFKKRYNNNNDLFLHIRLGDVDKLNMGLNYYINCIKKIKYDNIYIASDNLNHEIVLELKKKYNAILVDKNIIETIQLGSTCKNVILSHGSFSALIGYLSFFSNVYFPDCKPPNNPETNRPWCDIGLFMGKGWIGEKI